MKGFTPAWLGAAVLVSGLLYGAAFPPLGLAPLAWIALAPLFAACAACRPLAGAGLGLLWSLVAGLAAAPFLPDMLASYFRVPPPGLLPAALGLLLLSAGVWAAPLGAFVSLASRRGARPIVLAMGLVGFEYARSSFGLENSWALLADALVDLGPLAQAADLAGPWGLGLLPAWSSAVLAAAATRRLRGRPLVREALALAAVVALASGYGALRARSLDAGEPSYRALLVQGGVARAWDDADASTSLAELERHLALSAGHEPVDLIVWPEGALDFPPRTLTKRWLRLRRWSRHAPAPILFGAPRPEEAAGSDRHFNSMWLLDRGRVSVAQDKVHRVPFAERAVAGLGSSRIAAGEAPTPLEVGGRTLGIVICSEIMSPSYVRSVVRGGAEVLVNASNDYWFASLAGARLQLAKARLRAIETRRPVLRATSTGVTAAIDATGRVLGRRPWGGEATLLAAVRPSRSGTPYLRLGDLAAWLCLGGALLGAWGSRPAGRDEADPRGEPLADRRAPDRRS